MIDTLFSPNNGNTVPGQSNISNILLPIPGKKIKAIEGINIFRIYTIADIGVNPILTLETNVTYLLNFTSSITIPNFTLQNQWLLQMTLNGSISFDMFPYIVNYATSNDFVTHQIFNMFTDKLDANLVNVEGGAIWRLYVVGYKMILENI